LVIGGGLLLFFVLSYFLAKWQVQKKTQELRASEDRYRTLVEHAPEAILVLNADSGLFEDANGVAAQLFGGEREALMTKSISDISPRKQPGGFLSENRFLERIESALEGDCSPFEWVHLDGEGREFHAEVRLVRLPSEDRRLVRASISDISERKHLEAQIRHQDKIAAVGTLAAGVAHEIGNPLLAISMAAQGLQKKVEGEYAQKKLSMITSHIDRITRIVQHMSDLARPPSEEQGRCDVHTVIERALEIVRYDKRAKQMEIATVFEENLPSVHCVEDQLVQVFINLSLNAVDALESTEEGEERRITVTTESTPGPGTLPVRIVFEDTGPGIPEGDIEKIFQPFFTTKAVGKGTGLGLAVSHRIISEHEGSIRVESEPGRGTRFVVELPAGTDTRAPSCPS
ncbi:MAG: two-component system sensor histidine kinase NtrB, partial [Planctomycetota bacterium]